ncbi:MAG TPA: hypothetical protein O0X38_05890 [Methanocorpusculum sp.]|nr:hypothetical protein [Methanocorpusculum sp.]
MGSTSDKTEELVHDIRDGLPKEPDDPYEKVFFYQCLLEALTKLQAEYTYRRGREIQKIRTENIRHPAYQLVIPVRKRRSVDVAKLRVLYPEIYDEFAYIKPYDIIKIFGRKSLRTAAVQLIGEEETHQYEAVNVTEIAEKLTADELKSCVTLTETEQTPVVRQKRRRY